MTARIDALIADPRDGVPLVGDAWDNVVVVAEAVPLGARPDWTAVRVALRVDALARLLRFVGHQVWLDHAARRPLARFGELAAALEATAGASHSPDDLLAMAERALAGAAVGAPRAAALAGALAAENPAEAALFERLRASTDAALAGALAQWWIERDEEYGGTTHPELVLETLERLDEAGVTATDAAGAVRLGPIVLRDAAGALTPGACDVTALLYRRMHFHATRIVGVGVDGEAVAADRALVRALEIHELRVDAVPLPASAAIEASAAEVLAALAAELAALAEPQGPEAAACCLKYAELQGRPPGPELVRRWWHGPVDLHRRATRRLRLPAPAGAPPVRLDPGPPTRLAAVLVGFPELVLAAAAALDPAPLVAHLDQVAAAYRELDDGVEGDADPVAHASARRLSRLALRQLHRVGSLLAVFPAEPGA